MASHEAKWRQARIADFQVWLTQWNFEAMAGKNAFNLSTQMIKHSNTVRTIRTNFILKWQAKMNCTTDR